MPRYPLLTLEFLLLCAVLPTIIIVGQLAPYMFLFLWGAAAICILLYKSIDGSLKTPVWGREHVTWPTLRPIILRWVLCSLLLWAFTAWYDPGRLFQLVENRPDVWAKVMLLYPILSALPQEFIFCTFFFVRYKPLFPTVRARIIASSIVFAYAHVMFINPVAPILSVIGGYFFASTYARHRSLLLVTIEHALYGNTLFTLGLGWYFWGGALR